MKPWGWGLVVCFSFLTVNANAKYNYQAQYDRAIQGVLNNIQSNGAVVASPSRSKPDYYYDWVRDTSLTMKTVITLAYSSKTPANLRNELLPRIDRWIKWELARQAAPKLTDQGEPRFYIDGRANNEPWGRPQNDGPALRALSAMLVANQWINEGRLADVSNLLYRAEIPANTLIKRDLEYVAHHWQEPSFDPWEEEKGSHFYTLTVQKVALLKGAMLADRLGDAEAAKFYKQQSQAIQKSLDSFWDPAQGIIRYGFVPEEFHLKAKTTGLDIAVILAAIQTYDGNFYVNVDQMNKTVQAFLARSKTDYPINGTTKTPKGEPLGTATGRYPGDIYSGFDFSGGNPWFLSTLAIAEYYCDVNKTANIETAKAQFNRVLFHMDPNGSMSEQFRADTGFQQGARDLTWSYTSFITAFQACFQ